MAEHWYDDAACAEPENDWFFKKAFPDPDPVTDVEEEDPEEQQEAASVCFSCPVRDICLATALERGERWGVWGGAVQKDLRAARGVDADGVRSWDANERPYCLYCNADLRSLTTTSENAAFGYKEPSGQDVSRIRTVQCTACGFSWESAEAAALVDWHRLRDLRPTRPQGPRRPRPA